MKTTIVAAIIFSGLVASAAEKPRLPASLTCNSRTTQSLQELVYILNVEGTIKQGRYEKMMNSFANAPDCDSVNELMISSVKDCTVKALKKTNCK